jgi:hypothetical protein
VQVRRIGGPVSARMVRSTLDTLKFARVARDVLNKRGMVF